MESPSASPTSQDTRPSVLIVDDEDDILDLLSYNLDRAGFSTFTARDGVEALETAEALVPDLIVLDIMMPRMDGLEACRRLRGNGRLKDTPILMLTAHSTEDRHVEGLDVGADIYLSKPISVPVLLSQIRALMRAVDRTAAQPEVLTIHDLTIDRDRYRVFKTVNGSRSELRVPRKEFELLYYLASNPGKVFSRQQLLDEVWGRDVYVVDRTVDVHVRKIREKFGSDYIETVKGVGYRFAE